MILIIIFNLVFFLIQSAKTYPICTHLYNFSVLSEIADWLSFYQINKKDWLSSWGYPLIWTTVNQWFKSFYD